MLAIPQPEQLKAGPGFDMVLYVLILIRNQFLNGKLFFQIQNSHLSDSKSRGSKQQWITDCLKRGINKNIIGVNTFAFLWWIPPISQKVISCEASSKMKDPDAKTRQLHESSSRDFLKTWETDIWKWNSSARTTTLLHLTATSYCY